MTAARAVTLACVVIGACAVPRDGDAGASATSGRRVRIVTDPGAVPVPGAVIEYVQESQLGPERMGLVLAREVDPFTATDERGVDLVRRVTAGADGAVWLPGCTGQTWARARSGALLGLALSPGYSADDYELVMSPCLRVRVVDAAGAPQKGVRVGVVSMFITCAGERDAAVTDADGIASLLPPSAKAEPSLEDAAVRIAEPLAKAIQARVAGGAPPAAPVTLVIGPTGTLAVRLMDADGQPFTGGATVMVSPHPDEASVGAARGYVFGWAGSAPAHDGVARFDHVSPGQLFDVRVEPVSPALRSSQLAAPARGPSAAGDHATIDVVCGLPALRVSGRAVQPDGTPRTSGTLFMHLAQRGADIPTAAPQANARIGPDGRFVAHFDIDPARCRGTPSQIEISEFNGVFFSDAVEGVLAPLPAAASADTVDVGDVVTSRLQLRRVDGGGVEGSLAGLLRRPESNRPNEPHARVWASGPTAASPYICAVTGRHSASVEVRGDRLTAPDLPPGTYTLDFFVVHADALNRFDLDVTGTLTSEPAARPVFSVDNVIIRAGETNRDPRLQNIDASRWMKAK